MKRAIGSVTESVIAAQVMQMVEAGELDLDDPATDHLPPDLDFDSNGATIRQLQAADLLDLVPDDRAPAGEEFGYTDTNYLLLGLVIEQIRGRPSWRCAARRRPQHRRGQSGSSINRTRSRPSPWPCLMASPPLP